MRAACAKCQLWWLWLQTGVSAVLAEFRGAVPPLILDSGKQLQKYLIQRFTFSFKISFKQRWNRCVCPSAVRTMPQCYEGQTKPSIEYPDRQLWPAAATPHPQADPGAWLPILQTRTTELRRERDWVRAGGREASLKSTLLFVSRIGNHLYGGRHC